MLKIRILLFLFLCIPIRSSAQLTYGNEWINFSQKYFKIKVSTAGLYGISVNDIIQSGLVTQNINPNNFQLYNQGKQVPILVTGAEDNIFNNNDKIVFFGKPNDAALDKPLYSNLSDLPNEEVNLFEDINYYFLTYSENSTGLRYQQTLISNPSLTSESFIICNSRLNFSNNYYPGEYILSAMSLSEYIEGEGYSGNLFAKGDNIKYDITTGNYVSTLDFQSNLSLYVAGRSNALSSDSQGRNHHLKVQSSSNVVLDTIYRGYKTIRKTIPISINSVSTSITLSSIDDIGAATDFQAPGYIEIRYSRNLDLNNIIKELSFSIDNSKTTSLLSFTNANISQPILFDLTSFKYYTSSLITNNIQFAIDNNKSLKNYHLGDLSNLKVVTLENVNFKKFQPNDIKSFLIISNKSLESGVNSYLNYNNNERGITSTIAYVDDIYNEFYYGFQHPLAIKNFCSWSISKGAIKPEYLLLLGKGYDTPKQIPSLNLVPTYGYPASDNLLTSGIINNTSEPALATGRIPVKSNSEIESYLEKLKIYEQLPDSLWRKKLVHVTGGRSSSENSSFKNYLQNLSNTASGEYFGAYTVNFNKNVTDPVTESITEGITKETRNGAALISFLGHGSTSTTEVSLGNSITLNNANKPTIYLVNGCSTGNSFTETTSYGEQFILQKNNGAVGWIGTTSEGVASYLFTFSNNFYKNWFNSSYSKSISFGIKEGIKISTNLSDKLSLAHSRQFIFLGDPYIKYMSSEKPDYALEPNSIYLSSSNQNASQEKLKFNFIISNLGKVIKDSVDMQIKRKLSDNTEILQNLKIKPVFNKDTFNYEFNNTGNATAGNNSITIIIDPQNKISEINRVNNQLTYTFFLRGNNVNPLFPLKNSILSTKISLEAQPDNLFTQNATYVFEIDTVISFNSGFKLNSGNIIAGIFPKWEPQIVPINNKVYYWRVKMIEENSNTENWQTSSFTYVMNADPGFDISHKSQIIIDQLKTNNILYDDQGFKFTDLILNAAMLTRGDNVPAASSERRLRVNNSAVSWWPTERNGITIVSYSDKNYGNIFNYPSPYNSWDGPNPINGYVGQFYWDTNIQQDLDSMLVYLNNIPKGYHVIGFNNLNLSMKQLPLNIKQALKNIGLSKFENVGLGEPYMFVGRKGSVSGSALEITADYNSIIDPRLQTIIYDHDIKYSNDNGYIISPYIGPSKEWINAEIVFSKRPSDILDYSIIGVNKDGIESELLTGNASIINLSSINASNYPYIRLKTNIKNSDLKTVPPLNHWRVFFTSIPELTFNPEIKNNFHSKTISLGDTLRLNLGISNLLTQNSNLLRITSTIRKQDNSTITRKYELPTLDKNTSTEFILKESTIALIGKNNIKLTLENKVVGDNYNFNNIIDYNFEVINDTKPPLVDVFFDGKRIINREIISSTPVIDISSSNENKFLLQSDTSSFNVYLKKENENNFNRINFSEGKLNIIEKGTSTNNRLIVRFTPDKLEDGIYTLKIISKDITGNSNLENDFLTDFEIINESTISNFYPYPNPVINSMRFVFTLTGNKIPDKVKIQILTQSGKVVREISKEELGNIRIGNNVSDFVWDCKDQFGDRLANGVYFYKVFIEDLSESFSHRKTKGDTNFKNMTGKIYLLR